MILKPIDSSSQSSYIPTSSHRRGENNLCKKVTAVFFLALVYLSGKAEARPCFTAFEPNAYRYFPGFYATETGKRYCQLPDGPPPSIEGCNDALGEQLEEGFRQVRPETYAIMQRDKSEGGYVQRLNPQASKFPAMSFFADPTKVANNKLALEYLEKEILQNPRSFFEKSSEEILDILKSAHSKSIGEEESYRIDDLSVTKSATDEKDPRVLLKEVGGTAQDKAHLMTYYRRMSSEGVEAANGKMTWEEYHALTKIFFLPPRHLEVEPRLQAFAKQLKKLGILVLEGKVSPITAAAWAHFSLSAIHPYVDGNGRFVRNIMNTFLRIGGYGSIPIQDDEDYMGTLNKESEALTNREFEVVYKTLLAQGGTKENHPAYKALLDYCVRTNTLPKGKGVKTAVDRYLKNPSGSRFASKYEAALSVFHQEAVKAYQENFERLPTHGEVFDALKAYGKDTKSFPANDDFYKWNFLIAAKKDFDALYEDDLNKYIQNPGPFARYLESQVEWFQN